MLLNQIQINAESFQHLSETYWINPASELAEDIHIIMYHLSQTGTPNSKTPVPDMIHTLQQLYQLFTKPEVERFLLEMNEQVKSNEQ